jgi:ketosteroid isomerase-like protein
VDSPAVTLIREAYEAMNDGRLDWVADNLPPDFELVGTAGFGMGPFVGPEGVARLYAELTEAWETVRTDVEEVFDFGKRVVVLGRIRNRGRGSGIEVDVVAAHLWTVEDGVPIRIELIGDREEALRRGRAESSR